MKDKYRTKQQLLDELAALRQRLSRYEPVDTVRSGQAAATNVQQKDSIPTSLDIGPRKQPKDVVRESETRYRTLVEDMPALVCRFLPDGALTFVNEHYCQYFGKTHAELEGQDFFQFIPKQERETVRKHYASLTPEHPAITYEHNVLAPDGTHRWHRWIDRAFFDERGRTVEYQSIGEDITDQKSTEQELHRQKALLEAIFKDVPDAMVMANTAREIIMCNPGTTTTFGYEPEELIGKKSISLYESAEEFERQGRLRFNLSADEQLKPYVVNYRRKNGEVFAGETVGTIIRDNEGNALGFLGVIRDITERKHAEEALRGSEARFRDYFKLQSIGIAITSTEKRWIEINDKLCEILGYPRKELLQSTWAELTHPDDLAENLNLFHQAMAGELDGYSMDKRFIRKDRSIVYVKLSVRCVRGSDGQIDYFLTVYEDMTERKQAEESLRRYERIVSTSSDLMTFVDTAYVYQAVNAAYFDAFGKTKEEIVGHSVSEILGTEVFETRIKPHLDQCIAGAHVNYQHWLDLPARGRRYLDVHYDPYRDAGGSVVGVVVDVRDITAYKQAENALRASEERYRALYDDNPSMYFTVESNGAVLSVNTFGAEQLGYARDELVGVSVLEFIHKEDRHTTKQRLNHLMYSPGELQRWEVRVLHKTGSVLWTRAAGRAISDVEGRRVILLACEDITAAHLLSEELSYQASHDALTGLFNRREFDRVLQRLLRTAETGDTQHALCYLDLDQFKVINDICGHMAGDQLLRHLGQVLKTKVRHRDILARLGGDEFGILMEHCPLENSERVAKAVQRAIQDFRFVWEGRSFSIGVSIGLVPIYGVGETVTSLLSKADAACYAAKDAGRNRIHIYHETDIDLARRRGEMQLVSRINQALERDYFHLAFQRIAPLKKGDGGEHYELLIRMEDEAGHIVPPSVFLAAAERYNLSTKVDRWVISTAFKWLTQHSQQLQRLFLCSTNLSGYSLGDENFLDFIVWQFEKTRLPPEKICFEVTETATVANFESATRFIEALKGLGCRFALDDFGSGLSSFAYLKNLPVDFIKIDGVFVKDIVDDPIALAMVNSINEIGHVMGKQTIAEFVETDTTLAKLREIGVDYAQGYGVGRPQPIEEML